ncbi:zinc ribbon domain-containing protein [bacterium]|nr:zinc ribbon domain-containing protein [bacterium]
MPIYEFLCENCGHKFSTLCKVGEEVPCPVCGGETQRLFSTFAIGSNNSSGESTSSSSCSTCTLPSCSTCKL